MHVLRNALNTFSVSQTTLFLEIHHNHWIEVKMDVVQKMFLLVKEGNLEDLKAMIHDMSVSQSTESEGLSAILQKRNDADGMTIFLASCQHGHTNIVEFLLENSKQQAQYRNGSIAPQYQSPQCLVERCLDVNDWTSLCF